MQFLTVRDVSTRDRRVLVRVDFNVPLSESDTVSNDSRIVASLPTIRYLREQGAKVIVVSHLGRPGGRKVRDLSLAPVARRLSQLLQTEVTLTDEVVGRRVTEAVAAMKPGEVLMLENVRFDPGETENDTRLARRLAGLADIYVNDAFGAAHRAHASTHGVAEYLPGVMGLLFEREIRTLSRLRDEPEQPYVAILGGAKISDKLPVCRQMLSKVDALAFGGGLANTFLLCLGYSVGNSLAEPEMIPQVRSIVAEAGRRDVELLMPLDLVVARTITPSAETQVVDAHRIPRDWMIVDIGPRTVSRYEERLKSARCVFWNGPMGIFEIPRFARGTEQVARAVAGLTEAETVVGGGESVQVLASLGLSDRVDHVSTAGGAALEFLAGRELPALQVLQQAKQGRTMWVGGNWKMNTRRDEAAELAREVRDRWTGSSPEVAVFPPHPFVEAVGREIRGTQVGLGGQDCHWDDTGPYTGGVSAIMLRSVGARYVLVGHSECREHQGDSDERVRDKLKLAASAGLSVVLCVGEDPEERDSGEHLDRVSQQLEIALQGADDYPGRKLIIAYEPVWAIGTGRPARPEDVEVMVSHIRSELARLLDAEEAGEVRVVYGGSVSARNVCEFVQLDDVDGVLVGGASLEAESFVGICQKVRECGASSGED
ncbi:MAG: triose-phosphate isomerase [Bacillota bacterium]